MMLKNILQHISNHHNIMEQKEPMFPFTSWIHPFFVNQYQKIKNNLDFWERWFQYYSQVYLIDILESWSQNDYKWFKTFNINKNILNRGDFKMIKYKHFIITVVLFLSIIGTGHLFLIGPHNANACGTGRAGGGDYVPQRNDSGYLNNQPAITQEQAVEIVTKHISKLNPNLIVGKVNDAGSHFEAEILTKNKEIVQLLGVDKYTGRLMLLS